MHTPLHKPYKAAQDLMISPIKSIESLLPYQKPSLWVQMLSYHQLLPCLSSGMAVLLPVALKKSYSSVEVSVPFDPCTKVTSIPPYIGRLPQSFIDHLKLLYVGYVKYSHPVTKQIAIQFAPAALMPKSVEPQLSPTGSVSKPVPPQSVPITFHEAICQAKPDAHW